jgi:hypothetical protein
MDFLSNLFVFLHGLRTEEALAWQAGPAVVAGEMAEATVARHGRAGGPG